MQIRLVIAIALFFSPVAVGQDAHAPSGEDPGPAHDRYEESDFLSRVRRLTFEGRRAGEGYFSPDGKKLVFQSERQSDNPFFQIYELDLATGDTRRVSNGVGKTTCAFYQAGTGNIEYASTHHDPEAPKHQQEEIDRRAEGRERRYAWDFDAEMDIFLAQPDGTTTRLTDAHGYDAEGSFSPDGQWIVFSSIRDAYVGEMTDAIRKQLEIDPSFYAELYIMRADGTEQRRLTDSPGYDGGPFFTSDGKRIVWRRFDEQGLIADIWSMRSDGTDLKQITEFGSMSWAPYPHPSGEYIVFTSNKLGFENFELFIVDTEGTKAPVRITYTKGFDGLPVPSPDGKTMIWTSTRKTEQGHLFLARWNHEKALAALREAPARGENEE